MKIEITERIITYLKEKLNLTTVEIELEDASSLPTFIEGYCKKISENKYLVSVNFDLKLKQVIDIIIHEMRHVHQQHTGRLKMISGLRFQWDDELHYSYWYHFCEQPYEVDANLYMKQMRQEVYKNVKI